MVGHTVHPVADAAGHAFVAFIASEKDVNGAVYTIHYIGEPTGRLYLTGEAGESLALSAGQARALRDYIDGWLRGLGMEKE